MIERPFPAAIPVPTPHSLGQSTSPMHAKGFMAPANLPRVVSGPNFPTFGPKPLQPGNTIRGAGKAR